MLKKRNRNITSKLLKFNFEENYLNYKLAKSLFKNLELDYTVRLSFSLLFKNSYFLSRQKLICYITCRPRVPTNKLGLSRYHIVRYFDSAPSKGYIV